MASEKRMINAWKLVIDLAKLERSGLYDHENVLAVIASQETVDAVEVVHGRWIKKVDIVESYLTDCTEFFYECSVCECASPGESPYCPNCGAKMDGDGNG